MPSLGNFFSNDFRKNFAHRNIAKGSVIKCFVRNTNPPKEKRFVILGENIEGKLVGVVFINTNINWKVINTIELAQLQLFVRAENHSLWAYILIMLWVKSLKAL